MSGEIGLAANSDQPLISPTEVANPTADPAGLAARNAFNNAHMITLDDGASVDYVSNGPEDTFPFPWLTPTNTVRMGANVTFTTPVVFDFRGGLWRLQPQGKVGAGANPSDGTNFVQFEQDRPATPDDVLGATGDLRIATFNMLNYFNTLGEDWAASDGTGGARTCTYFSDKDSPAVKLTDDDCHEDTTDPLTGLPLVLPGPRGAANAASFKRQEDKELEAINTMNADVMSLEEVENSVKLYEAAIDGPSHPDANRDDAISHLVTQLNAHWLASHPGEPSRWAFAPSPRPEAQPTVLEQDAIRSAFIYNPSKVELVGRSRILTNSAPFRNAREPLAQAFKPLGMGRAKAFAVIVNHFKSKGGPTAPSTVNGDNVDNLDGAGFYNGDRKRQAAALLSFADQFLADKNISAMFMTGDYNAYSQEDPIKVLTAGGYTDLHPSNDEKSYSFAGLAGSLDHVFVNPAAQAMVTGEDIWSINANESVYYEYSRFNSNLTNLYAVNPFRSSDHNPEIIGVDTGVDIPDPAVDTVQILATNDFHGRILDDPGSAAAGAAALAGAVKGLRADNPDTIFASAGDNIGASTFESFLQNDKPTIDALNEAGLEVSAAGNHEFDKGYNDLVNRVMAPYNASTNPQGGAEWRYIAANVRFKNTENGHTAGDAALPETWCKTLSSGLADPVTVGFVGAVTEDLPALVAAGGIADLEITDIVDSVNTAADNLKTANGCGPGDPADLVIELVHEGAATTAYSSVTDGSTFGHIVAGADPNIDAIVSGHTHLAYNHKVPVPAWSGRAVTERPVVSAGQYGSYLNRLQFEFTPGTHNLVNIRQTVLALKDYDADPATQTIVDNAVAYADLAGSVALGDLDGPFRRAQRTDPVAHLPGENRGGESTLGNLIAEIQRWKTGAQIGFMNPGGLRADLNGTGTTSPRPLSYRDAANAQPFANTLETMDLTGAQIKVILEQQWQRDADGNIPSRPFLRLGTSAGFTSTFDPTRTEGDRITGMFLDGTPLDLSATYHVSATSFLASGTGDNFWGFAAANNVQDTGKTDLEAVVDYMGEFAEHGVDPPLPVDYRQHQVGVHVTSPGSAPYVAGNTLTFTLSSLAMTAVDDGQDSQVEVLLDGTQLGTGAVSNTLVEDPPDDSAGKATVTFTVPVNVPDNAVFVVHGLTTDTSIKVPVDTSDGLINSTVTGTNQTIEFGQAGAVPVHVTPTTATGTVTLKDGSTVLGSTNTLTLGEGSIDLAAGSLPVGPHALTLVYSGDGMNGAAQGTVNVTVTKATPMITATPTPASVVVNGATADIAVTVSAAGGTPTGTVTASVGGNVVDTATLSSGSATLTVGPFATAGDKTVTIDYSGDANTAIGSKTTTVGVDKAAAAVSATPTPASVAVNGGTSSIAVTVTSDATGDATGTVTASVGGNVVDTKTLSGGSATLTVGPFATVGDKTITIDYLGDTNTAVGSTTATVGVTKAAPTITATPTPASVVVNGGTSSIAVTVASDATGDATGTVTASVGGNVVDTKTLANGAATLVVGPFATTGVKTITIAYGGDASTQAGSTTTTVDVTNPEPESTAVSATAAPMTYGTAGTVNASVTPNAATGTVTVKNGATTLGTATLTGGTAQVTIPGTTLEPGSYTLAVSYSGDATHTPSTTSVTLVVNKQGSTVAATAAPMTYGTPGAVNATVAPATATGTVTVTKGSQNLGTGTLSGGQATIAIGGTALEPGSHTLTVSYGGDAHHAASSTTVTLVVNKAASTTAATAAPTTVVVDEDETTVTVVVSSPAGTPTGAVQAYVDGEVAAIGTLSGGMATLQVGPFDTLGTATIEVRYLGDNHVAASQDGATVEVVLAPSDDKLEPTIKAFHFPDKVKVDKTRAMLTVKVKADPVTPTGSVRIRIPGHGKQVVQLQGGKLKLKLPKFGSKGDKVLVITYLGDDNVHSGQITHVVTVTK